MFCRYTSKQLSDFSGDKVFFRRCSQNFVIQSNKIFHLLAVSGHTFIYSLPLGFLYCMVSRAEGLYAILKLLLKLERIITRLDIFQRHHVVIGKLSNVTLH